MIELIATRHGQSEANVAFPRADAAGSEETGITGPDSSVELTDLGRGQAAAFGRWLAGRPPRPTVIVASPYRRARETIRIALAELSTSDTPPPRVRLDERLRDRELGVLEMLPRAAIRRRYPAEQERRDWTGDFLYRPPGGESMADVVLRTRSFVADAVLRYAGQRVLVVGHDATVLSLRYVIEELSEEQCYAAGPVHNASVTRWVGRDDWLELAEYNTVEHLTAG